MSATSPFAQLLSELPIRDDTVDALGSATRYWTYGPADAVETLVIVHGYRGEHHGLEPVVAHLRGIRVVMPDLPGFGESLPLTDRAHDIAGYAEWLGAFVSALGLGGATVLGHSFGSIVVAHAIAGGQITPPRTILVNPIASPATTGPNQALTKVAMFGYRSAARLPEPVGRWLIGSWGVVQVMSNVMAVTKDRTLRRFIHDQHHTYFSDFATLAVASEGFAASVSHNVIEVAASITMPTLLIAASHDQITPLDDVRALQRAMPAARLEVIDGVGHLVHYEKSREAATFVARWLGVGSVA